MTEFTTKRTTIPAAEEILGSYFPVLDHGFVSLVDYMGGDESVERAARVSFGAGTRKVHQTRGLIRYLRRHKHTTPSEMVELKFHCAMPIFIARQWIRHRTANVNEFSGRYSLMPMLFYKPEHAQLQLQSKKNHQGRSGEVVPADFYEKMVGEWNSGRAHAQAQYENLTANDVARELARIDLPLSTYTQWYWKIDLHNLLHFLTLRVDSHAQFEIQEFGKVMAGMLKRLAPISYEAWIDYDVCGVHLSNDEMRLLRSLVTIDAEKIATQKIESLVKEYATHFITDREYTELVAKWNRDTTPDFELDISKGLPGSFFEEKMAAAVPKGDAPPTS
jgi:thymidylate synthase (FAD)